MNHTFLIVHDYGMGGLWAACRAPSAAEILNRWAEIKVFDKRPSWMAVAEFDTLCRESFHFEDQAPSWLRGVERSRPPNSDDS